MNNNYRVASGLLLLCAFLFCVGCGSSLPDKRPLDKGVISTEQFSIAQDFSAQAEAFVSPRAPWEVWPDDDFASARLGDADKYVRSGELEKAIQAYRQVELSAETPFVLKAAFIRRLSTRLKLGESKAVLDELSSRVKQSGSSIDSLDPELTLLAAFAYRHNNNPSQAFAWFGLTRRKNLPVFAEVTTEAVREIVQGLSQTAFDEAFEKWQADAFLSPIFVKERLRRVQGGQPIFASQNNWFSAKTYQRTDIVESDFDLPATSVSQGKMSIGVLLPLSGDYAVHGGQAKKGIELALSGYSEESRPQVFFEDTAGDEFVAVEAYNRLVSQHGVDFVLGPLLSKTTDRVARESVKAGVSILSFTKRPGIVELGLTVFRLGATNQGQASDLASFGARQISARTFAVLYPIVASGVELADSFSSEVSKVGGQVVVKQSYNRDDEFSLEAAVDAVYSSGSDVVFVPDTIERAYPLIALLRKPPVDENGELVARGSKVTLLGPAYWDDPVAIRGYGPLLDGSYYVTPFNVHSQDPYVQEFVQRFKANNDTDPDILSAQAYDALRLVVHALKHGSGSRLGVISSLKSIQDFPGVSGLLSVARDGEIHRRMSIIRIDNGDPVEVSQFSLESAAVVGGE